MTQREINTILKHLGANISAIRKARGMTQIDLSYEIDTDRANISKIEAGLVNPTTVTLAKISKALSVEIKDLFDSSTAK